MTLFENLQNHDQPLKIIYKLLDKHKTFIPRSKITYSSSDILGEGSSGTVYKADLNLVVNSHQEIAVKVLKLIDLNYFASSIHVKRFIKETNILHKIQELKSPNIVKYYGFSYEIINDRFLEFIMLLDHCEGTLEDYLKLEGPKQGIITLETSIRLMSQLTNVLLKCQRMNISHGDLKLDNILIKDFSKFELQLCDFSEASQKNLGQNATKTISQVKGNFLCCSPQILYLYKNNQKKLKGNPYKSDLYAIGVITVLFVLQNKLPTRSREAEYRIHPDDYNGQKLGPDHKFWETALENVKKSLFNEQIPKEKWDDFIQTVKSCLAFKEKDRPIYVDIKQNIDQKLLAIQRINDSDHDSCGSIHDERFFSSQFQKQTIPQYSRQGGRKKNKEKHPQKPYINNKSPKTLRDLSDKKFENIQNKKQKQKKQKMLVKYAREIQEYKNNRTLKAYYRELPDEEILEEILKKQKLNRLTCYIGPICQSLFQFAKKYNKKQNLPYLCWFLFITLSLSFIISVVVCLAKIKPSHTFYNYIVNGTSFIPEERIDEPSLQYYFYWVFFSLGLVQLFLTGFIFKYKKQIQEKEQWKIGTGITASILFISLVLIIIFSLKYQGKVNDLITDFQRGKAQKYIPFEGETKLICKYEKCSKDINSNKLPIINHIYEKGDIQQKLVQDIQKKILQYGQQHFPFNEDYLEKVHDYILGLYIIFIVLSVFTLGILFYFSSENPKNKNPQQPPKPIQNSNQNKV